MFYYWLHHFSHVCHEKWPDSTAKEQEPDPLTQARFMSNLDCFIDRAVHMFHNICQKCLFLFIELSLQQQHNTQLHMSM